jgi:hypothetical protein
MKKIILILSIIMSLGSFAKIPLSEVNCKKLSIIASIRAFSPDINSILYTPYSLSKGEGMEFIQKAREALDKKMSDYCNTKKSDGTIEEFVDQYTNVCSQECQDQSKTLKDTKVAKNGDSVCLSICNKSTQLLVAYGDGQKEGFEYAQKKMDCIGDVNSGDRNQAKETDVTVKRPMKDGAAQK